MHNSNVDTVDATSEVLLDDAYLDAITSKEDRVWQVTLSLGNTEVPFKMVTGAEVTAISDKVYQSLDSKPDLQEPTKTLLGPARQKLSVGPISRFFVQGTCLYYSEYLRYTGSSELFAGATSHCSIATVAQS